MELLSVEIFGELVVSSVGSDCEESDGFFRNSNRASLPHKRRPMFEW